MTFEELFTRHEVTLRLGFFFGVFGAMALWESIAPRRALSVAKLSRWWNNLGLVALNSALLRVLFPAASAGVALFAKREGWGLFNDVEIPYWAAAALTIVALDLTLYLQHVLFHAVPLLWRIHQMHHADLDVDVTTGARFHPIEIVLSLGIKASAILLLGAPPGAVIAFEVLLNATAMFNHGNVFLPEAADRALRAFVVTPDMHRIHHSIEEDETNSNFGFNLSCWDRLFATYRESARKAHPEIVLGLRDLRDAERCDRLVGMLKLPFVEEGGRYPMSRRSAS